MSESEEKDVYKTIAAETEEVLFKDRNSKFFGIAFPVKTETEIKTCLENLKNKHPKAGHFCYAWQLGKNYELYRANDDGEPANSAGMPIFGQLQSFEATNVLVVVLRYFGGTKLGVSGLINAYRTTAKMALEEAKIIEKTIDLSYKISFDYPVMNKVMRIVKEQNLTVVDQILELDCVLFISVRKKDAERIFNMFDAIFGVKIESLED
ncbi:MAG TPA: YigZ family protein [Flavobacteriaceae bacterium]|nr:YigZ family protein [Flavobacteriaceae bacterium]